MPFNHDFERIAGESDSCGTCLQAQSVQVIYNQINHGLVCINGIVSAQPKHCLLGGRWGELSRPLGEG